MPEGPSPYRHPHRAASPRIVLRPLLLKRVLGFLLFVAITPSVLYATVWSRIVTIACEPTEGGRLRCEVRQGALVGGSDHIWALGEHAHVRLRGVTEGTRGDAWIELDEPTGRFPMTDGLNVDKAAQAEAARIMEDHLRAGGEAFAVSYGSRYAYVFVPILGLAAALLGLFVVAQRAVATVDRAHRLFVVETARFPLRPVRVAAPLDDVAGFRCTVDKAGRPRVEAVLRSGESLLLFLAHGMLAARMVEALSAFLRTAREG